jgi:hypothetical protein
MTRAEMVLETLVYSPSDHLMHLQAWENYVIFYNIFLCRLRAHLLYVHHLLTWDTTSKKHYPMLITLLNAITNFWLP